MMIGDTKQKWYPPSPPFPLALIKIAMGRIVFCFLKMSLSKIHFYSYTLRTYSGFPLCLLLYEIDMLFFLRHYSE